MTNKLYLHTFIYFMASISIGISIYEMIPLYAFIADSFGTDHAVWAGSIFSLGYAIGFLMVGWLMSKIPHKPLLLTALGMLILNTLLIGFTHSFSALIVIRFFQGIFASVFAPIVFSIIIRSFPKNRIPLANSAVTSGFVIAGVIGQLFASFLFQFGGWFFIYGVQALIYFLIVLLLSFTVPGTTRLSEIRTSFRSDLAQIVRNKRLWLCFIITFTLLFAFVGMYTAMGTYFADGHAGRANFLMTFRSFGLIGILFAIFLSTKTRTWSLSRLLSLGLACASFGIFLMAFVQSLVLLTFFSIVFAFGIALTLPMVVSIIGRVGGSQASTAITLYTFILFIGATIGPLVISPLLGQAHSYTIPFLVIAGVLLVSLICSFILAIDHKNEY
ncbi:MFS transporter [Sporolactobacillus shoreicorticis]|uniref:MFS transporter n=1 Tax=Sporolactobacillus shoreicorticis TaxID=1923877 RepID=A0ABW5S283_9BACL|nr:MFS transporter [Sporolactobacillus shoreicorticis]MCO7125430.1 MFS transporter [Sporolactobacillus shoreicorticis]